MTARARISAREASGSGPDRAARIIGMVKLGMPDKQIAGIEGITVARVIQVRKAADLAPGRSALAPEPARDDAAGGVDPILATGGRYAELAGYAAAHGVTITAALQMWHRARAAQKGGAK